MEIMAIKDEENDSKPTAKPVVYFKDFERRFDDLLTKNQKGKTPRGQKTAGISPRPNNMTAPNTSRD